MEIREIISFYINEDTQILDVTFRTIKDAEDEIRMDQILLSEVENFGYKFANTDITDLYKDIDDEEFNDLDISLDVEDEDVISFLNEYYLIYGDRIPKTTIY
jgi:hypothetical protein